MGIEIKPLLDSDPGVMLGMCPCADLDRYVLHHILEAPPEFACRLAPTMRFADCYAIVVKLGMEGCVLSVSLSESNYSAAAAAKQIVRRTPIPAWCVVCGPHKGYGRNLEEAICKLAICRKFDVKNV